MKGTDHAKLSRRERQIMDIIFELGQATAAEVLEKLADPPSYSAVRAMLRILEEKSHLKHHQVGPRYVYQPTVTELAVNRSMVADLTERLFAGRPSALVNHLLAEQEINADEIAEISRMIEERAREERG